MPDEELRQDRDAYKAGMVAAENRRDDALAELRAVQAMLESSLAAVGRVLERQEAR